MEVNMKAVAFCLLVCASLQGYVHIEIPDEETAESCRIELERILSGSTKKQYFGFFSEEDADPEDPFLEPIEQLSPSLDDVHRFEEIPLQDWERQIITFIITEMAEKNVFQLLLEKNDMERKGKKINHVHPLRFIGHVCEDQKLRRAMKVIKKNPFKWDNFINGFSRRVREEVGKNNLFRFIPSFCEYLQVHVPIDEAEALSYLRQNDPEGFVRYLISN